MPTGCESLTGSGMCETISGCVPPTMTRGRLGTSLACSPTVVAWAAPRTTRNRSIGGARSPSAGSSSCARASQSRRSSSSSASSSSSSSSSSMSLLLSLLSSTSSSSAVIEPILWLRARAHFLSFSSSPLSFPSSTRWRDSWRRAQPCPRGAARGRGGSWTNPKNQKAKENQ